MGTCREAARTGTSGAARWAVYGATRKNLHWPGGSGFHGPMNCGDHMLLAWTGSLSPGWLMGRGHCLSPHLSGVNSRMCVVPANPSRTGGAHSGESSGPGNACSISI